MANAISSYGSGGALTSTISRRGFDIGPQPDFYRDLNEMTRRLGPLGDDGSAGEQAGALRGRSPLGAGSSGGGNLSMMNVSERRPAPASVGSDYEPYFGTLTYPHGSAGFYNAWVPGMNVGTGQAPVAMGYTRGRRR